MIYLTIILIAISAISALLFSYEEYSEWLRTEKGDLIEHVTSVPHRLSLIVLGYLFATYNLELITIPLQLGVYWTFNDIDLDGSFLGTLNGAFPTESKVIFSAPNGGTSTSVVSVLTWVDANTIKIRPSNGFSNWITNVPVVIEVLP